jgi:carboxypeptidase T
MNWSRSLTVFLFALTLLTAVSALAAETPHALVLVHIDSAADQAFIKSNTGHLDILKFKSGSYVEIAAQESELQFIKDSGLRFEILNENMEASYASRSKGAGFGIFHTYSESVAFVDSLRLLYPEVISEKWSIGQTGEGRDIWCFRVSDNPDVDEDEPEILIDGMHHAREIMASEFTIMFAEYLAQNYGTDAELTWLVNNRELYIVPIVNPDGVVYNEQTNPNGGGMWRKNRRNNGGGSYGVDPNRNYPFMWGFDNSGSSPDPDSDTYRGPSAGSEPEVQALMNFINGRNIITHDTVHCYSNLTLYPWGYTTAQSAHHSTFVHMGNEMTKYNGYAPGTPGELLYTVNGGTFDWAYGATDEHDVIYSFSNEIGTSSDGFWPDESRRGALFQENIWPHIYLMRAAGDFIAVHSPVVASDAKTINPGESGTLDFTIENQSVVTSAMGLDLTVTSNDPWVRFGPSQRTIGSLAAMATTTLGPDPLPIDIDTECPNGHLVDFTVTLHLADGDLDFELSFMVGAPNNIFSDDFEGGLTNWTTTGAWGLNGSTYHSASNSLTDSPVGEYSDEAATSATLNGTYQATSLSFWHRFDIEDGYDYGRVQVSADGGAWLTLASYDGTQTSWQEVVLDLSDYAGQNLAFRFLLDTDYSVTEDGWYIDDVAIIGAGSDNLPPATPVAISPIGGQVTNSTAALTVSNVTDPEGQIVKYGFNVYNDIYGYDPVNSQVNIVEGPGQTTWEAGPLSDGTYYWRAYASDGVERSLMCEMQSFTVETTSSVGGVLISNPQLKVLGNVTGGQARLQLNLPASARVTVDIYDTRGARIRQLHTGSMASGSNVLVWDGKDSTGRNTSSGVYFVRAQADSDIMTSRVVVVR